MDRVALPRSIETVVIGAGQAGLAASWFLRQAGREHLVLDRRERLGGGWPDRWETFRLVTPNGLSTLPGYAYDGSDPDGFMPRDEVAARVARYAEVIHAPVALGTDVLRVAAVDPGVTGHAGARFRVETDRGAVVARDVVIAAGPFQLPSVPSVGAGLSARVAQLHSHAYREERRLPPGAVLVVGSGQTGVQLAEELHAAGRRVVLSVGHCGRIPRRYRGRDVMAWIHLLATIGPRYGTALPTVDTLPDPRLRFAGNPHLSGHDGGHDTNLRRFAANGIRLVGHLEAADGERVRFAPDLADNLRFADAFFDERFRTGIDTYIERAGIAAPPDDREPYGFEPPPVDELDLAAEGIGTVLWTSGFRLDLGWVDFPILDEQGAPRHRRGVTEVPGLTFLGLPWQHDQVSATLMGIGRDAEYLAERW